MEGVIFLSSIITMGIAVVRSGSKFYKKCSPTWFSWLNRSFNSCLPHGLAFECQ